MKTWEVDGVAWVTVQDGKNYPIYTKLVVRYTSDAVGKSLSISDDVHGLMLEVPFDAIEKELTGGKK